MLPEHQGHLHFYLDLSIQYSALAERLCAERPFAWVVVELDHLQMLVWR